MAQTEGTDALITESVSKSRYYNLTAGAVSSKVFTGSVNTDANGDATFNIPPGFFTEIHAGYATVGRATTAISAASFAYVRSSTLTQIVCRAAESKNTGVLVGGNVEGLEFCGAGVTVNIVVYGV